MCSIYDTTMVNIWPTNEYNDKTITLNKQFSYPISIYFWKHTKPIGDITQPWPNTVIYTSMRRMINPTKNVQRTKHFTCNSFCHIYIHAPSSITSAAVHATEETNGLTLNKNIWWVSIPHNCWKNINSEVNEANSSENSWISQNFKINHCHHKSYLQDHISQAVLVCQHIASFHYRCKINLHTKCFWR